MMKKLLIWLVIAIGCTEPIELEFESDRSYVVIDGFITNEFGPHVINVTMTAPFVNDDISFPPRIRGAVVTITDNLGNVEVLFETPKSSYLTSTTFRGIPGRSYTLNVNLQDESYSSTPQTIPEPSSIDSVFYSTDVITSISEGGIEFEKDIVRFFADVSFGSDEVFSALSWDGTFRWEAILNPGQGVQCFVNESDVGFSNLLDPTEMGMLQKNMQVDWLVNGDRFVAKYSFNALLYTFGSEANEYLMKIDDQANSTASVFDPLPFQINGNIANTLDNTETVLGFFGAYSLDSERIFVSKFELQFPVTSCGGGLGFGTPPQACVDCRAYSGANTNKPSFWID